MKLQVLKTIEKYQMISHGETVVLAVSGGVDSMVLMDLFVPLAKDWDLTLVIAHMDHAKRACSTLDAELVHQIAKKHHLVFEKKILPQQKASGNFHAYARKGRYAFFKEVAKKYHASKIVTAHHADDHLETIIDRLMKTEVPAGLIGVMPKGHVEDVPVIRPLIEVKKKAIYDYAKQFAIPFHEDVSNESDDYLRNRIRHHVAPHLITERPDIIKHVRALSDHLSEDEAYFEKQIDQLMVEVKQKEHGYEFSLAWLQRLPSSLYRRILLRLLPEITKGALCELNIFLNNGSPSGICHVGGDKVVRKSYDHVHIVPSEFDDIKLEFSIKLEINSENELPDGRKIVLTQGKILENRREILENRRFDEKVKKNEAQGTYLCYNSIRMPLTVRHRQAGDRIQLIGKQGHATVKKIMIDAKVPIYERNNWLMIVDANEKLVWIPELKKSPVCLEKPNSNKDLWLEICE